MKLLNFASAVTIFLLQFLMT